MSHKSCAQHAVFAMYSVSAVDMAMTFCFLEAQETRHKLRLCAIPEVDVQSVSLPAQLASVEPTNRMSPLLTDPRHKSGVPLTLR